VEAAVQRKVEGKEVSFAEPPSVEGGVSNVVDLMEVLKASLNARAGKAAGAKERKAPKKASASGEAAASKKSSKR
jgi:non-homologous end joining protein Ku